MDIPRRKEREGPDKLTSELVFFCSWITNGGEVDLYLPQGPYGHSLSSYYHYSQELRACGAVPHLRFRHKGTCQYESISVPPVETFHPSMRFDLESEHLRRLARLVCMLVDVLKSLPCDYCRHDYGSLYGEEHDCECSFDYPTCQPLYADLDERTFYRDKKLVAEVVHDWMEEYVSRFTADEESEEQGDYYWRELRQVIKKLKYPCPPEGKWDDEEIL